MTTRRAPRRLDLLDRWLLRSTVAVTVGAVLGAVVFWATADRWWVATLLLFGPRWVLLAPLPPLMILAYVRDRRLLAPLALSALVVIGPIMGFRSGWRAWLASPPTDHDLTVVTFNARNRVPSLDLPELMATWGADVAVFQECGLALSRAVARLTTWHVSIDDRQCMVSRFEILDRRVMDRAAIERAGGSGLVTSYRLAGTQGPFWITNVHLETPREGLALIRYGQPFWGMRVLRRSSVLRDLELRESARFAQELGGPHITAGDFNTPPESVLYRRAWGHWTNAFSSAGFGFGGTRLNGWIRARIDHVVVDDAWEVVDARLGEQVGSDHLPVIAVLRRR